MSESVLKMQFDEIRIVTQTCLSIWLGFIKKIVISFEKAILGPYESPHGELPLNTMF